MKNWTVWFGLLTLLVTKDLFSQETSEKKEPPVIRVQGDAVVTAKPDQAVITISVVTQGANANDAAKKNAENADRVMKKVRAELNSSAEIKTTGYNVNPDYRYPKEGGQPQIVGYTVTNTIEVRTGRLEKVGDVIDKAISAGANNITGLQFHLKDESPVAAEALQQASRKARAKADAVASALGVRVVRVLKAEESGPVAIPVRERMVTMARSDQVETPVEAGTIEVQATVTLTVEIR